MAVKTAPATATLELDRDTKNTGRYVERDSNGEESDAPIIGTIYVPKTTLSALTGDSVLPGRINVSVEIG